MKKFFSFVAAVLFAGSMMADVETVYNWADNVGSSTMGTSVEATTVKIHTNTDAVNCIKFSSSYVYVDGKYLTIKPAEGGFKAGDVLSVAIVFNNADDTKYAQIDLRAADGDTRIWLSDSASTINGRTSAAEPIVQTYTLEADQDSLLLGRYGNTAMCVTLLSVVREAAPATPADPTNCAEAREAALSVSENNELYNNGAVYTIEGYVTSIQTAYSDQFHNVSFWIADTQDGGNVIQAFRAACENADAAPEVGDKVQVTGSLTKYNTTPEFAQGCTFVIVEKGQLPDPVNLGEKTIAEFLTLANTRDTCILTGTIANVVNTQYGNFDLVELGNAEVKVYVYGLLTAAGESKKCYEEENLAEGDTITVKAIYTTYNNAPQVKNAIFVSVKHATTPEEGVENVVADQKAIKKFENGVLIIEKNGIRYNATGAIVK